MTPFEQDILDALIRTLPHETVDVLNRLVSQNKTLTERVKELDATVTEQYNTIGYLESRVDYLEDELDGLT